MAIVLRSSLESWVFQAGRLVWEQARGERRASPTIPQLRAALVERATAAARAETRSELIDELRGVFDAALALAAERGIARRELDLDRGAHGAHTPRAPAPSPEPPQSEPSGPETGEQNDSASFASQTLVSSQHGSRKSEPRNAAQPDESSALDRAATSRAGRIAARLLSDADRAPAPGTRGAVSTASAADRELSRRDAPASGTAGARSHRAADRELSRRDAPAGRTAGARSHRAALSATASMARRLASAVVERARHTGVALPEPVRAGLLREAVAIVADRLTTPASSHERSITRVSAASRAWRADAVLSSWLRASRREPSRAAAISGQRGAFRALASRLFARERRSYHSRVRFALRARWPSLRERSRQRQFKVVVDQRSKGMALAAIPAAAGAQLAAWAVTTTSRFLLERWVLPYLMRKAAPLRVAPVAGKLLWGFGRVAVPTGLRLLARTPSRAR
jgi:hypothetical protein